MRGRLSEERAVDEGKARTHKWRGKLQVLGVVPAARGPHTSGSVRSRTGSTLENALLMISNHDLP